MEVKLLPPPGGPDDITDVQLLTPCLVEVGARCHGAEGFWMSVCDEGYAPHPNQERLSLDAYVNTPAFDRACFPGPPPRVASGKIKYLIIDTAGALRNEGGPCHAEALEEIMSLASYRAHEIFVIPGAIVGPTIDCFSWGGCVKLCNADDAVCDADYARVEELCHNGLWAWYES
mmetsp:Transcript_13991/g.18610  ORF Transcript_13991/g.18610 Transcript_13991/m.18610 type:complete len:174 (+) Transcript_13991:182-703(+)